MTEITKKELLRSVRFPIFFIGLLWVIHILKITLNLPLNRLGVLPRESYGIKGIFTSPLIHSDFGHLGSNSIPAFVLLTILFIFYRKVALKSFALIYVLTGLAVWLFAHSAFHIGASGVVYGLVSFVFWSGIFRRNVQSIVLALIVTILYSGYFVGIVPNQPGISWESHLFGAIVGIFVAYLFRKQIEAEKDIDEYAHGEEEEERYFFERDTFG
jgi:membrane associated rhomboid family serine protease